MQFATMSQVCLALFLTCPGMANGAGKDFLFKASRQSVNPATRAPISEEGYLEIAAMHDDEAMSEYVRRVVRSRGRQVTDEGMLHGFVPHFSGTIATQSLVGMINELQKAPWASTPLALIQPSAKVSQTSDLAKEGSSEAKQQKSENPKPSSNKRETVGMKLDAKTSKSKTPPMKEQTSDLAKKGSSQTKHQKSKEKLQLAKLIDQAEDELKQAKAKSGAKTVKREERQAPKKAESRKSAKGALVALVGKSKKRAREKTLQLAKLIDQAEDEMNQAKAAKKAESKKSARGALAALVAKGKKRAGEGVASATRQQKRSGRSTSGKKASALRNLALALRETTGQAPHPKKAEGRQPNRERKNSVKKAHKGALMRAAEQAASPSELSAADGNAPERQARRRSGAVKHQASKSSRRMKA